ncbi:hypothetical protein EIP91_001008 [Steccherinum ochraceum]|uniref:Uncharacterized protein n=1 Tax=Steccherinum ochraceum TaxID=92696 RepID=A0A4R0RL74_9APHY|nr:hypothetical protein EIP91_001008 [Steccherinum ochraceum]
MSESSDVDVLSHFSALDELIQLIYQGAHKFVILSAVDDNNWAIHVGLSNSEGRWWRGTWSEKDIRKFVGTQTSSIVLESFADRLAQTLIKGDLIIGDWSSERGADINLTLGPKAKTPIRVPLTELGPADAAAYATKVFVEIALQAQSRQSRLHHSGAGSTVDAEPARRELTPPPPTHPHKRKAAAEPIAGSSKSAKAKQKQEEEEDAKTQGKIRELEAQLAAQKRVNANIAQNSTDGLMSKAKTNVPSSARPAKGASLANPNKKARKYQALEFESDDE